MSSSVSVGTTIKRVSVGVGSKEMLLEHTTQPPTTIVAAGVLGSVGVGLNSPINVSVSTYDMLSRNIGRVLAAPMVRGDLRPNDFTGFLNIVQAGCGALIAGNLTLLVFSKVPLLMGPIANLSIRAITAATGTAIELNIGCSIGVKSYVASLAPA